MHPLVKDFLTKKEAEETAGTAMEKAIKKSQTLLKLGLYEKEYTDRNECSVDYPYADYDETGAVKYYRKVPVEVSDEEYEELLKYQKSTSSDKAGSNFVAAVFKFSSVLIFIVGFVTGLLYGNVDYGEFSFAVAFMYWSAGFISGMTFLGFGEIIQLLTDIKNN